MPAGNCTGRQILATGGRGGRGGSGGIGTQNGNGGRDGMNGQDGKRGPDGGGRLNRDIRSVGQALSHGTPSLQSEGPALVPRGARTSIVVRNRLCTTKRTNAPSNRPSN